MDSGSIKAFLERAIHARQPLFDPRHEAAFRLFNGFLEGAPDLVVDLYAATALLHNYADPPEGGEATIRAAQGILLDNLPWVQL